MQLGLGSIRPRTFFQFSLSLNFQYRLFSMLTACSCCSFALPRFVSWAAVGVWWSGLPHDLQRLDCWPCTFVWLGGRGGLAAYKRCTVLLFTDGALGH